MTKPLDHLQVKFSVKAASDDGRIEGLGAVFNNVDDGWDVVHPGAFKDSLRERRPLMLWQHDAHDDPVGVWDQVEETDEGLYVSGRMILVSPQAQQRHALLKAGALDGLSIGFMIPGPEYAKYDGENVRHITKADLWEVSVVNFPMNREARISAVKNLAGYNRAPTPRQAERLLRDAGWSLAQAKALLAGGYNALKADWPGAEPTDDTSNLLALINAARGNLT
jgi:uncharacterized protein